MLRVQDQLREQDLVLAFVQLRSKSVSGHTIYLLGPSGTRNLHILNEIDKEEA